MILSMIRSDDILGARVELGIEASQALPVQRMEVLEAISKRRDSLLLATIASTASTDPSDIEAWETEGGACRKPSCFEPYGPSTTRCYPQA